MGGKSEQRGAISIARARRASRFRFWLGRRRPITARLKCNSHRGQIWVYGCLSTFDVETKLKCGENVEIVGRVQDYVKIRAQNGVEGYVPQERRRRKATYVGRSSMLLHPIYLGRGMED